MLFTNKKKKKKRKMITDVCDPIAQSYKFMGTAQCQTEQFWFPKSKEPIYCKQSRKACYMSDI